MFAIKVFIFLATTNDLVQQALIASSLAFYFTLCESDLLLLAGPFGLLLSSWINEAIDASILYLTQIFTYFSQQQQQLMQSDTKYLITPFTQMAKVGLAAYIKTLCTVKWINSKVPYGCLFHLFTSPITHPFVRHLFDIKMEPEKPKGKHKKYTTSQGSRVVKTTKAKAKWITRTIKHYSDRRRNPLKYKLEAQPSLPLGFILTTPQPIQVEFYTNQLIDLYNVIGRVALITHFKVYTAASMVTVIVRLMLKVGMYLSLYFLGRLVPEPVEALYTMSDSGSVILSRVSKLALPFTATLAEARLKFPLEDRFLDAQGNEQNAGYLTITRKIFDEMKSKFDKGADRSVTKFNGDPTKYDDFQHDLMLSIDNSPGAWKLLTAAILPPTTTNGGAVRPGGAAVVGRSIDDQFALFNEVQRYLAGVLFKLIDDTATDGEYLRTNIRIFQTSYLRDLADGTACYVATLTLHMIYEHGREGGIQRAQAARAKLDRALFFNINKKGLLQIQRECVAAHNELNAIDKSCAMSQNEMTMKLINSIWSPQNDAKLAAARGMTLAQKLVQYQASARQEHKAKTDATEEYTLDMFFAGLQGDARLHGFLDGPLSITAGGGSIKPSVPTKRRWIKSHTQHQTIPDKVIVAYHDGDKAELWKTDSNFQNYAKVNGVKVNLAKGGKGKFKGKGKGGKGGKGKYSHSKTYLGKGKGGKGGKGSGGWKGLPGGRGDRNQFEQGTCWGCARNGIFGVRDHMANDPKCPFHKKGNSAEKRMAMAMQLAESAVQDHQSESPAKRARVCLEQAAKSVSNGKTAFGWVMRFIDKSKYERAKNFLLSSQRTLAGNFEHLFLLDNGSNHHIINDKKFFSEMWDADINCETGGGTVHVDKAGNAWVQNTQTWQWTELKNAIYMPECPFNIISENTLVRSEGIMHTENMPKGRKRIRLIDCNRHAWAQWPTPDLAEPLPEPWGEPFLCIDHDNLDFIPIFDPNFYGKLPTGGRSCPVRLNFISDTPDLVTRDCVSEDLEHPPLAVADGQPEYRESTVRSDDEIRVSERTPIPKTDDPLYYHPLGLPKTKHDPLYYHPLGLPETKHEEDDNSSCTTESDESTIESTQESPGSPPRSPEEEYRLFEEPRVDDSDEVIARKLRLYINMLPANLGRPHPRGPWANL